MEYFIIFVLRMLLAFLLLLQGLMGVCIFVSLRGVIILFVNDDVGGREDEDDDCDKKEQ